MKGRLAIVGLVALVLGLAAATARGDDLPGPPPPEPPGLVGGVGTEPAPPPAWPETPPPPPESPQTPPPSPPPEFGSTAPAPAWPEPVAVPPPAQPTASPSQAPPPVVLAQASHEPGPLALIGAMPQPPPLVRDPPPDVRPDITGGGYVFPVYGPASFSDDFGAPRADTGWHHGNDIFAPLGAPILAVAAGTVFSVGWNPIGGWRLWVRDAKGNEFYYAHLSAYSPAAADGARVEPGVVLGFVGDSGDAQGTPYHLHFEVHPASLLGLGYDGALDPYPYLTAWRERQDASFGRALPTAGPAPLPGAVLLEIQDISTAGGLVPGAVSRVLGLAD